MASQQAFKVKVSKKLGEEERLAMGLEIIDSILDRTSKGLDKNNKPFPGYSTSYLDSLDFKLGGKSKNKVNLELSGEMLGALEVLDVGSDGEIVIGIAKDDATNNAKAEGNILGTYGQSKPIAGKKRDFMGIPSKDLKEIKEKYKVSTQADREKTKSRALNLLTASQIASGVVDALDPGVNNGE